VKIQAKQPASECVQGGEFFLRAAEKGVMKIWILKKNKNYKEKRSLKIAVLETARAECTAGVA